MLEPYPTGKENRSTNVEQIYKVKEGKAFIDIFNEEKNIFEEKEVSFDEEPLLNYIETDSGVFTKFVGYKYLYNGYPDINVLQRLDIVKRCLLVYFNSTPLIILPFKWKNFIKGMGVVFGRYEDNTLEHRYCRAVRELRRAYATLGLNIPRLKTLFSIVLEWDNAYRFRLQDVLPLYDKTKPIRSEIRRLTDLMIPREINPNNADKIRLIRKFLLIATLIPKYRRLVKKFLDSLDMDKIKLSDADKYFCRVKEYRDYSYLFLTNSEVAFDPERLRYSYYDAQGGRTKVGEESVPALGT